MHVLYSNRNLYFIVFRLNFLILSNDNALKFSLNFCKNFLRKLKCNFDCESATKIRNKLISFLQL